MNMSSISVKKYIFIVLIAMSSGLLYSSLPPQRNILRAAIKEDLRKSLVTLAQLVTLPDHAISDALDAHDVAKLVEFQEFTDNFHTQMVDFKKQVEAQLAKPKPVTAKSKSVAAKPSATVAITQQSVAPMAAAKVVPIALERKTIHEATVTQKGVAPQQLLDPNKLRAPGDDPWGASTKRLMQTNPKFKAMMIIGGQANILLRKAGDDKVLKAYVSMRRAVTNAENVLLIKLQTKSNQKLENFIKYVKALIEGKNILSFCQKFVGDMMIDSWIYEATQEMDVSDLGKLEALFNAVINSK